MDNWNEPTGKWQEPVVILLETVGVQTVEGPYAAALIMQTIWPLKDGRHLREATAICLAACEREASLDEARLAFLSAVEEAGIRRQGTRENTAATRLQSFAMQVPSDGTAAQSAGQ